MVHVEASPIAAAPVADAFRRLWDHLVVVDPEVPCDAIFCFGSRSSSVPAAAAGLYQRGVAPLVVVTGGVAAADGRCEAEAYADALVGRGVPPEAIVVERHARHTGENVALGLAALDRVGPPRRIVAVSWALGMRRALATFARHRPALEVRAFPALPDDRPRWDATPENIHDAMGEWDRLAAYSARGDISLERPSAAVRAAAGVLAAEVRRAGGRERSRRGGPLPRTGLQGVAVPVESPR